MNIDRSNYESFFIDYLDGKLSNSEINEILDFLSENPDLQEELESISDINLKPEHYNFPGKASLRKNGISRINSFENRSISFLEGDLSDSETLSLLQEITEDENKERAFNLIQKAKLSPDTSIVYPDKNELYKHESKPSIHLWMGRIAAILLLAIAIWALYQNNRMQEQLVNLDRQDQIESVVQVENDLLTEFPEAEYKEEISEQLATTDVINEVPDEASVEEDSQTPLVAESIENETLPETQDPPLSETELPENDKTVIEEHSVEQISDEVIPQFEQIAENIEREIVPDPLHPIRATLGVSGDEIIALSYYVEPQDIQELNLPFDNLAENLQNEGAGESDIDITEKIVELDVSSDTEMIVQHTDREPVPEPLEPISSKLENPETETIALAEYPSSVENEKGIQLLDEFLAKKILNTTDGESISLESIANAGINVVKKISNNRLNVEKNMEGKVSEIKYESKLLAFSIPTKYK